MGRQGLSDLASGYPLGGAASSVLRHPEFEQKVTQCDPDGGSMGVLWISVQLVAIDSNCCLSRIVRNLIELPALVVS